MPVRLHVLPPRHTGPLDRRPARHIDGDDLSRLRRYEGRHRGLDGHDVWHERTGDGGAGADLLLPLERRDWCRDGAEDLERSGGRASGLSRHKRRSGEALRHVVGQPQRSCLLGDAADRQ